MDPAGYQYYQQQVPYYPPQISVSVDTGGDRFPQWSIQETRDFLVIRSELDLNFMESKRNKHLWDVISTKMKDLGYNRSPDQCKCKWKNLVTRYKGCGTMEGEGLRQQQFPFYDELQAIFGARMQRMLWTEAEEGGSGSKQLMTQLSSDEDDEEEESHHDTGDKKGGKGKKKRKVVKSGSTSDGNNNNDVKEILENFMKQQMEMEMRWMKVMEQREEERRRREMEWRQRMEALENERILMEKIWKEKEEEWRTREEARAERRDALINILLTRLTGDHS